MTRTHRDERMVGSLSGSARQLEPLRDVSDSTTYDFDSSPGERLPRQCQLDGVRISRTEDRKVRLPTTGVKVGEENDRGVGTSGEPGSVQESTRHAEFEQRPVTRWSGSPNEPGATRHDRSCPRAQNGARSFTWRTLCRGPRHREREFPDFAWKASVPFSRRQE